jgi:hypothetical protein
MLVLFYAVLDSSPVAQSDEDECKEALAPKIPASLLLFLNNLNRLSVPSRTDFNPDTTV